MGGIRIPSYPSNEGEGKTSSTPQSDTTAVSHPVAAETSHTQFISPITNTVKQKERVMSKTAIKVEDDSDNLPLEEGDAVSNEFLFGSAPKPTSGSVFQMLNSSPSEAVVPSEVLPPTSYEQVGISPLSIPDSNIQQPSTQMQPQQVIVPASNGVTAKEILSLSDIESLDVVIAKLARLTQIAEAKKAVVRAQNEVNAGILD